MRSAADAERVRRLARELGSAVAPGTRMYLTGGATAVLDLEVFDFDPYSQALSKLERGFELDLDDVRSMVDSGRVEPGKLRELHAEIEADLYRFPAVDPASLRAAVQTLRESQP